MNILMINYMETTAPGGINTTVQQIAKHLHMIGHEVTVLQANPLNLPKEEIYDGYRIVRIGTKFGNLLYGINPEIYFYLKNHLTELNPDIVHIHGYHTLLSPEIIYSVKMIHPECTILFSPHFGIFSHDTFAGKILWRPYNELIGRKIMKYSEKIIVASNFEANNVNSILGVPMNKIVIIPHGVDIIDLKKNYRNNNPINILYAGYLLELKGVQHIIKALKELIYNKRTDVLLTIIGNGPYEGHLKKLSKELGVNDFIDWKDFMHHEELMGEFKKASIFLLTSKSENYGIVVPEALALGTPVIVTKRTALKEFLNEPGCFGVDYPPDPAKLSDLIQDISSKNVGVGPFSNKIRTWDKVTEDYENIFHEMLNLK